MPEPAQSPTPQRAVYYTRAVTTPEGEQRLVANTAHARARIWALLAEYEQATRRQRRATRNR